MPSRSRPSGGGGAPAGGALHGHGAVEGPPRRVTGDNRGADRTPRYSPDGRFLVFTRSTAAAPPEIYSMRLDGVAPPGASDNQAVPLTRANDEMMRVFSLRPAEEVTWEGAGGARVAG